MLFTLLLISSLFNATASEINHSRDIKQQVSRLVDARNLDLLFFKQALANEEQTNLKRIIHGLGRIGGKESAELIKPFLFNSRQSIRRAAAFAIGISGSENNVDDLWRALDNEKSELVKQELYLALGTSGDKGLIQKLLGREKLEQNISTRASIFQALAIAVTYYADISDNIDMRKSQSIIDFPYILSLLEQDNQLSYQAVYFLARLKNISKRISPAQLQRFINLIQNSNNKRIFARLIGKVTERNHLANRRLLSWLIEHSEHADIALAAESIRAMATLIHIPQAKIQLGKLHVSSKPLIAQTALKVLADSSLQGKEITSLLKKQLKSQNTGVVVEAISGLMKRQERKDMTWALKILSHKSSYVKIRFARMIFEKDQQGFKNVLSMLSKDIDPSVASQAKKLLGYTREKETVALQPSTLDQRTAAKGIKIQLNTNIGPIEITMSGDAPYTTANFVQLVNSEYYNGTYFSRVIGNFVAQGGDNIGDGEGSSRRTIREELSYQSHQIGTIGMATAGKDTGDSQFFINTANNTHLDRHYTTFATVTRGMEVALKLSNGDQIISASVVE